MSNKTSLDLSPTRYDHLGFYASRNLSEQSFPGSVETTVLFDTTRINDNGCFNGVSTYTCPRAGRMLIQAAVMFINNNAGTQTALLSVIANATTNLRGNRVFLDSKVLPGASSITVLSGSLYLDVNVGTTLVASVFNNSANPLTTLIVGTSGETVYFSGFYLP